MEVYDGRAIEGKGGPPAASTAWVAVLDRLRSQAHIALGDLPGRDFAGLLEGMVEGMYQECTRSIQISVESFYVDEQSSPDQGRFVFGYRIQIDNQSTETVQLISRHWQITDSMGRTMEVKGPGVVGKQPVLKPGERFEYTSGTPLTTSSGIMVGSYQMVTTGGEEFDVTIPAFSLDAPGSATHLN